MSAFFERKNGDFFRRRFHDVFGDENLFMLDEFNENFLDLVDASYISPKRFFQRNGFK